MLFKEIIEARRNPEQNPKTSINQTIIDKLEATTDNIGGTKNLFVSFTSVDKLGINPKSEYDTPIGIYAYPALYVSRITGTNKNMNELPFAGNQPYVNLFKASGNIINISRIGSGEVDGYYTKLIDAWSRASGKPQPDAESDINQLIQTAKTSAKFKAHPGGEFWYVTMECATNLFAPKLKSSPAV